MNEQLTRVLPAENEKNTGGNSRPAEAVAAEAASPSNLDNLDSGLNVEVMNWFRSSLAQYSAEIGGQIPDEELEEVLLDLARDLSRHFQQLAMEIGEEWIAGEGPVKQLPGVNRLGKGTLDWSGPLEADRAELRN
jgi:hypothetical protein